MSVHGLREPILDSLVRALLEIHPNVRGRISRVPRNQENGQKVLKSGFPRKQN